MFEAWFLACSALTFTPETAQFVNQHRRQFSIREVVCAHKYLGVPALQEDPEVTKVRDSLRKKQ